MTLRLMKVCSRAPTARTDYLLHKKASGIDLVEGHTNDVLGWYARRGNVSGLEEFLQTFVNGAVPHLFSCLVLRTRHRSTHRPPAPFTYQGTREERLTWYNS